MKIFNYVSAAIVALSVIASGNNVYASSTITGEVQLPPSLIGNPAVAEYLSNQAAFEAAIICLDNKRPVTENSGYAYPFPDFIAQQGQGLVGYVVHCD